MTFTFDRDYKNLAQVTPFVSAFTARLEEIEEAGQYPVNDYFRGCLGIEGDEDTAIYLLQSLRGVQETANRINEAWDEGFRPVDPESISQIPLKVAGVIAFGWYMGGTGFARLDDVRLVRVQDRIGVLQKRQRNPRVFLGAEMFAKAERVMTGARA